MKQNLYTISGLIIIVLLGYLGIRLISWFAVSIEDIDPSIGAALIAGAATVISSVFITSYNSRKAKERVAFEAHREKKAEIYNEFMEIVVQLIRNTKAGKDGEHILPENIEDFFYKFTSKITVYGGPGVVKAFANWRSGSTNDDPIGGLLLVDKLFREMRADLGESNKGIAQNELLGLYVIGGKSEIAKKAKEAIKSS